MSPIECRFMLDSSYFLFFLGAAIPTILSPGPGVVMSVTNCLTFGMLRAQPGLIGVALGTLVVACLSATGLGLLLQTSQSAYDVVRFCGILFLLYLARRYWNAPARPLDVAIERPQPQGFTAAKLFVNGIVLQISNPALVIFYISLFPQCINPAGDYLKQFVLLSVVYSFLVYILHSGYGILTLRFAGGWLKGEHCIWINRIAAVSFVSIAALVGYQTFLA